MRCLEGGLFCVMYDWVQVFEIVACIIAKRSVVALSVEVETFESRIPQFSFLEIIQPGVSIRDPK